MSPKERIGLACLIGLLLFAFSYIGGRHLRQPAPIVFQGSPSKQQSAAQSLSRVNQPITDSDPVVDVVGAVKSPGVVHLPEGSRVVDAIHAAGGATSDADLEAINLAEKVSDGVQLRVPAKGELPAPNPSKTRKSQHISEIDKTGSFTPVTFDPANMQPLSTKTDDSTSATSKSGWTKKDVAEVDVNTASVEELQSLPGVGKSTAQKIFDYRQAHGPFQSADDLQNVGGIGPKKLEKMRPYVKV